MNTLKAEIQEIATNIFMDDDLMLEDHINELLDLFKQWALEMIKVYPEKMQPFWNKEPEDKIAMDSYYNGANSVRILAAKKIEESCK